MRWRRWRRGEGVAPHVWVGAPYVSHHNLWSSALNLGSYHARTGTDTRQQRIHGRAARDAALSWLTAAADHTNPARYLQSRGADRDNMGALRQHGGDSGEPVGAVSVASVGETWRQNWILRNHARIEARFVAVDAEIKCDDASNANAAVNRCTRPTPTNSAASAHWYSPAKQRWRERANRYPSAGIISGEADNEPPRRALMWVAGAVFPFKPPTNLHHFTKLASLNA